MTKKVYILENLGCANCAAKMETRICALPGVESAVITYATKQLRLCCENPDEVLPQIQAICSSIEPGTIVIERKRSSSKDQSSFNRHTHTASCTCSHDHSHEHHHDTSCDCGHDHSHEHHHDTSCDCDHDHSHEHHHDTSCGCGHDHSHEHHHDTSCDCGHDHSHEHHHVEGHPADCDCELCHPHEDYCDICGESLSNCTCRMPDATNKKRVFILENLGCANCAAKMEAKIKALPEVDYAALTFPTKQLRISAKDPEALLPVLQSICSSIEPEVVVVPRKHKVTQTKPVEEKKTVPDKTPKKKKLFQKENLELITIIIGGVLFLFGEILHEAVFDGASFPPVLIALSLIAYLILGWNLLVTAFKNIRSGQIFDENFLMSIATLGALAIQNYMEAVGVVLFFRIGEYFEHRAVENSRKSIMDAVDMRPDVVQLLIGEEIKIIDAEDAIVGDILLVRPGDRIPLDGVIIEGESQIDTSPVTGEPVPVAAHYGDEVVSGCINTSGLLKIRVEKPLEESMVTRILDSVENATANKPQIERFITKFARIYTPIVVVAAILVAFIPSLNLLPILPESGNWNYWIHTALTFLVISCPCALVLSVPLAFFSGIGAGSKKGILFKGGSSLEAIKQVSAVILDKTGTITYGDFRVQKVGTIAEYSDQDVLSYCASCELNSTHPIGNSIVDYAKEKNISLSRPSSVKEIAGKGIEAVLGEDIVLCGNKKLMEEYQIDTSNYQNELFGTEVLVAINHELIGYLILSDTIKPESKEAISKINHLSIHTVMLTGDAKDSANAVAKETGIKEVHSKLLPQDKLSRLKTIREQHGKVMFVGDGINDAPVLSGADVGAAMGSGSDVAIEAADVVFMNSNLTAIPESIEIAKDSSNAAMQNVVFALIIKAIVMILGLIGHASMWFAVFADSGVAILCVLNSIRILYKYRKKN